MEPIPFGRLVVAELLQRHAEIVERATKRYDDARREMREAEDAYLLALNDQRRAKDFIRENQP